MLRTAVITATAERAYARQHGLDGFVVDGRAYLLKASDRYRQYVSLSKPEAVEPAPEPDGMDGIPVEACTPRMRNYTGPHAAAPRQT